MTNPNLIERASVYKVGDKYIVSTSRMFTTTEFFEIDDALGYIKDLFEPEPAGK